MGRKDTNSDHNISKTHVEGIKISGPIKNKDGKFVASEKEINKKPEMMNVFGYLYYKFSRPYKRLEGEDYYIGPIALLSMCQTFNIVSLVESAIRFNMNNWILCVIVSLFTLSNANYFLSKNKREQYERRWSKEKGTAKRIGTTVAIAYIILSLSTYYASIVYAMQDAKYTEWVWDLNWSWRWW